MTDDRAGAPPKALWGDLTYRGFSAPGSPPPKAPSARRPIPRAAIAGGGLAAAVALGLIAGLWARPDLGHSKIGQPMRAVTPDADAVPADRVMAIDVGRPRPETGAEPRSTGKLEVLSPALARAAAPAPKSRAPTPEAVTASAEPGTSDPPPRLAMADPPPPPVRAPQVNVAPLAVPPVPAAPRFSPPLAVAQNACAGAGGRAAQMVCADPQLAAADRELNRAYRRALRSGAPPDLLRRDQRDWLAIREDAARRSPRAVAQVYAQRIDELNEAADDADDDPGY